MNTMVSTRTCWELRKNVGRQLDNVTSTLRMIYPLFSFWCILLFSFHCFYSIYSPHGRYMNYIYRKPYTRIAPYLIGLIIGYIISYKYTINGIYRKVKLFRFVVWEIKKGIWQTYFIWIFCSVVRNIFRYYFVKEAEFLPCFILSNCPQGGLPVRRSVIYVLNRKHVILSSLVHIFGWMGLCNWIWFGCCLRTIFTNWIYLGCGWMDNVWCNVSYSVGYSISLGYICMS